MDRRITKSKKALRDALIALMEERGFDGFTVNDLCERADLNRGTFYNHFRDKECLLAALEDEVMDDLERFQTQMQELTVRSLMTYRARKKPLPFLVELFDYLREQGNFLHAVLGPGGDVRFGPRLRDSICTNLVQSILHERYRNDPSSFVGYYVLKRISKINAPSFSIILKRNSRPFMMVEWPSIKVWQIWLSLLIIGRQKK